MSADSPDQRGTLRWVSNVLGRSIRLEQRLDQRAGGADASASMLVQQRAELGARLLVHDPATQPVRNLFIVHDELGSRGWPGVEALPRQVVARALTEAEIMASDEPSEALTSIIETLQSLKLAADPHVVDDGHAAAESTSTNGSGWETLKVPEVSETNYDEYELMERSWVGTVPAGL